MNNFTFLKDKDFSKGRNYIGASDVPTLCLLNLKYGQTPLKLFNVMTGREKPWTGNSRTKAGHDLEHIVLKWGLEKLEYSKNDVEGFLLSKIKDKNKYKNLYSNTEAKCPNYPFIVAHADLIDVEKEINIEAKSHGLYGAKRNNDLDYGYDISDKSANGIPASIYLQIMTQGLCYGIKDNYVSAMIDTGMHSLFGVIKSHVETQEKIIAVCDRFNWHVQNDTPPKPETWDDVIYLNPDLDKNNKTVVGGETAEKVKEMKERAKELRARATKIDKELKDLKNAVGLIIGNNGYLEDSEGHGLASAFEVTKYFLKNYKEMPEEKFNELIKDGFITESKYRDMRY